MMKDLTPCPTAIENINRAIEEFGTAAFFSGGAGTIDDFLKTSLIFDPERVGVLAREAGLDPVNTRALAIPGKNKILFGSANFFASNGRFESFTYVNAFVFPASAKAVICFYRLA